LDDSNIHNDQRRESLKRREVFALKLGHLWQSCFGRVASEEQKFTAMYIIESIRMPNQLH
jgi:hypothetical protein